MAQAVFARPVEDLDGGMDQGQFVRDLAGAVRGVVVDDEDAVIDSRGRERGQQVADERPRLSASSYVGITTHALICERSAPGGSVAASRSGVGWPWSWAA